MTASASLLARSCIEAKREQQLAVSLGLGDGIAEPGNGPCTHRQAASSCLVDAYGYAAFI
jgi:hypothetical protein